MDIFMSSKLQLTPCSCSYTHEHTQYTIDSMLRCVITCFLSFLHFIFENNTNK